MKQNTGAVRSFLANNFLHFNAASLVDAAKGYEDHLAKGGKMLVSLAGAIPPPIWKKPIP